MDYVLKEQGAVLNWFDVESPEGRYSLNDKISDIMKSKRGKLWFYATMISIVRKMKKNKGNGGFEFSMSKKKNGGGTPDGLMQMMGGFSVLRLTSMMSMTNVTFTKEELLKMNRKLNRIRKPKNI